MLFRLYRGVVLSVVFLAACTINKTKYTSGIIGCPERMITIAESSGGFTANTWAMEKLFTARTLALGTSPVVLQW